jgi:hypothetical protein
MGFSFRAKVRSSASVDDRTASHHSRWVFGQGLLEGSVMSRSPVPAALIWFGIAISIASTADRIQAQAPPAAPQLSAEEPTAKIAEHSRLWSEAKQLRTQGKDTEAMKAAQQVAAIEEQLLGADHKVLISTWTFVADCAEESGAWPVAESARDNALRIAKLAYVENDWRTGDARRAR